MIVTLNIGELRKAAEAGLDRHVRALAKQRTPRYDAPVNTWDPHIWGAIGECAVAKALNVYWPCGATALDYGGDVGPYHVRTRSRNDWDLPLHPGDLDNAPYLLVLAERLPRLELAGWCYGREGKQDCYWQTHTGRPCYLVPRSALHPFTCDLEPLTLDAR